MGGVPGVRGRHRTQDHLSAAVAHPASPTTGPVAARRSVTGVKPLDPRLLRHAATARVYLALTVGLGLASAVLILGQATLLADILPRVFLDRAPLAKVTGPMALLAAVLLGRAGIAWAGEVAAHLSSARVKSQLRAGLLRHAVALGPAWLARERSGELAALATRGVDALDGYFARYLPQLVLALLVPVAVLARVVTTDWLSAVTIAVILPLIPVFMALIGISTQRRTQRQWSTLSTLAGHFLDVVEEVTGQRAQGRPLPLGTALGADPDQRHEHRDQRQDDRDGYRGQPVGGHDPGQYRHRHQQRQHQLREVTGEVAVQRVDAPGRQRRQLAAALAGQPRRRARAGVAEQAGAKLGLDQGRGQVRRHLARPGDPGPTKQHRRQQRHRTGDLRQRGPVEKDPRQDVGQQRRLAEDENGTGQAQPDSQGEVDPGGRRMAQQPRVERLHARHATSGRHWSRGWAGRMAYRCAQVVLGAVAAANSWYAAHARGP